MPFRALPALAVSICALSVIAGPAAASGSASVSADVRPAAARRAAAAAVAKGSAPQPPAAEQAAHPTDRGYARPELLVTTAWLAHHLDDADLRIVDLRPAGYELGHIPGAVHLGNRETRDPANPPTFVPPPERFEQTMRALGISNTTRVVAYDERGGIYAARLWWLLTYYGHRRIALLDGGWIKWTREGRPTTTVPGVPRRGTFVARAEPAWLATASDVLAAMRRPGARIVDARTRAEIEGRDLRGIRRGGFIPGAIPVYWEDALDPEWKTFRPAAEIAKLYRDRGILPEHEVIAYCQVGMRAAHDLFALALVGYSKLRNYLGSWEEWGDRDDLPIATTAPPPGDRARPPRAAIATSR
jgi:thiosulfate/3-mercaptopyruvate sulfurtransferase